MFGSDCFHEYFRHNVGPVLIEYDISVISIQGTYLHHKEIKAAQGIKIAAQVTSHFNNISSGL